MERLEFSGMVVPGSMRSPYWKYFGFPSDSYNNIVTKKKIICTTCNAIICYNKNTTNLRTHLVAKHPEIFIKITTEKNQTEEKKNLNENEISKPSAKRHKLSISHPKSGTIITKTLNPTSNIEIVKREQLSNSSTVSNVYSLLHDFSTEEILEEEDTGSQNKLVDCPNEFQNPDSYVIEEIHTHNQAVLVNVGELIQYMIIKDLLDFSLIKGSGFMNLISSLGGEFDKQKLKEVEKNIEEIYQNKFNKCLQTITNISNSAEPFSLGLEIFKNFENKLFVNIYFVYLSKDSEILLNNIFVKCVNLTEQNNFDEIFLDINLKNCSAAVLNKSNYSIELYLGNKGIQITPCLDAVIYNCIEKIFSLSGINEIFVKTQKVIERLVPVTNLTELGSLPEINPENEWSKFNYLKYFSENVFFPETMTDLLQNIKKIYNLILPLKQTLETVLDEPISFCSLVKPLTLKLIEQNYTATETDSELILNIKTTVYEELNNSILNNSFLSEASFLDPRFQSFLSVNCLKQVKFNLIKKFSLENSSDPHEVKTEGLSKKTNTLLINSRKSSLKLFLEGNDGTALLPKINKNSFENEITKYLCENNVDLEHCPVLWWNEIGFVYKQLKRVSQNYFCVSCCANNLYKNFEQMDIIGKRFMLKENRLNEFWFLNYNKNMFES